MFNAVRTITFNISVSSIVIGCLCFVPLQGTTHLSATIHLEAKVATERHTAPSPKTPPKQPRKRNSKRDSSASVDRSGENANCESSSRFRRR